MKNFKKVLSVISACVLFFGLILSCGENSGLGASVDTESPKLSITYPPDSAVIRKSFVLAGTCEDDKSIKSVKVVFRDTNASEGDSLYFGPYEATVSDSKSWKITLNDYDAEKYAQYNGWQFPDGTYTAEVTVTDNAGHSVGPFSRTFDIDNTAPVFVVSAPGVKLSDVTSGEVNTKKYGSTFKVSGTIAEKHRVGMSVAVYDSDDDIATATPISLSEAEVDTSGTSSVEFARYTKGAADSDAKNTNYKKIYKDEITDDSGAKPFKATVTLTDNAKVYVNPSENSNTTEGNSTSKVFLNDKVYSDYLSGTTGRGLAATDFMNILNGTKTGALSSGQVSDTCENVREALGSIIVDSSSDLLSFSLNPNANPSYTVTGYDLSANSAAVSSFGSNSASKNSGLTIIAQSGENETNIDPASIKVWIYNLGKLESALDNTVVEGYINTLVTEVTKGTAVDSDGKSAVAGWTLVASNADSKDSSAANYNYTAKITNAISIGDYYLVVATGEDLDGAAFSQKNWFGFKGAASSNPPEIDFNGVADQSYFATSGEIGFDVTITQTDVELKTLGVEVTVKDESSGSKIDGTFTQTVDISSASKNADDDYEYTHAFKLSDVTDYSKIALTKECGNSYFYTIKFTASNSSGGSSQQQISLHVDATKPVVTITAVNPYADGADYTSISGVVENSTYLNGTIKVQGNIIETNLKNVSYEIYVDGSLVGEAVSLGTVTQFNPSIDTTTLQDGKEVCIKVIATDDVGNTGESDTTIYNNNAAYIIKQATDTPQISLSNVDVEGTSASSLLSSNVFTDSTSNTITGTITDDDGIEKVVATLYNEDGTKKETKTLYEITSNYRSSYKIKYELPVENGAAKQGIYGVKFDVYDSTYEDGKTLRHAETPIFYVGVDTGNPALTLSATADITNKDFAFSGTAGDVNGIKKLEIIDTLNENKTYTVDTSRFTKASQENAWSCSFVVGSANSGNENYIADGKHTFQIKATDSTDKTSTETVTISVDTTAPEFTSNPIASIQGATTEEVDGKTWYKTNSLPLNGTASDGTNGTGIASVEYIVSSSTTAPESNADWKTFAGTSTFTGTAENIVSGSSYVWIKLTDNAGNTTVDKIGTWYIDTAAPEVTEGSVKVGGTAVSESAPYYSNGTVDAKITFTVTDPEGGSGISKVYVLPYAQISSGEDGTEIDANKATVSNGSVSFTIDKSKFTKSGTVYARIYDYAGNYTDVSLFALTYDNTIPKSNNPVVADTSSFTAYKNGTEEDGSPIYYVNNADGTFTFSGIATDNLGIKEVKLTVTGSDGTNKVEKTTTDSEYSFENVSLKELSGPTATATITITDLAGNVAEHSDSNPTKISLKFDSTGPVGSHTEDAKGKDVYFRLGENDNDDIDENCTSPAWSDSLDKDVGGKYKSGTYGNANTIKLRGTFNDAASGVSMIYYKVSQNEFTSDDINSFKTSYASEKTGYFAPLSTAETKRVFYSVTHGGTDSLGGTKFKDGGTYDTYYNTFDSTYDATLSGFQVGKNYLMLVAVDNVGNAALDTVQIFQINVDTTVPEASAASSETILTNGKKNDDSVDADTEVVTITGTATDADSGLRSITFTAGGKTISSASTTYGTVATTQTDDKNWAWTLSLKKKLFTDVSVTNISVSAIVTDNAGSGNNQTYSVGNITVDTDAPTVTLNAPTDADKSSTDKVDINKTIAWSGNAKDGNTLADNAFTGLQYKKSTDSEWTDVSTTLMADYEISGGYSFSVSGFDTTKLDDNTSYAIRAVAVDKAGNTGYSDFVTVYVNQKSDRPVLNFTNLTTNASGDYILKLNDAGTVECTVTDDDSTSTAVVKSVSIQELDESGNEVGTAQTPTLSSSGDFTFAPSSSTDGAKYFKFTVVDNENTEFTSKSSTTDYTTIPVLSVKSNALTDSVTASNAFTYKADNEAPVVNEVRAVAYNTSSEVTTDSEMISAAYVVGGTERESVKLTIHASDANGIAGMLAVITKTDGTTLKYRTTEESTIAGKTIADGYTKAGTFTSTTTSADSTWELPLISVAGLASGSVKVTVTPYDNSGLTGNSTQTFTIDNDGPTVEITSHKNATSDTSVQYNGVVNIKGTASDSNDTVKVQWLVPTSSQRDAWNTASETTKAGYDWQGDVTNSLVDFTFSGEKLLDSYTANATSSGTYETTNTKWYIIPIYFKAEDEFGNVAYTTDYAIKFNPDLDKPVSAIEYPMTSTTDGETTTLGGTIRMSGTSTIPEGAQSGLGVNSVYVQIGATATFGDTDKAKVGAGTGNYGYTVVSAYDVINEIASTSYTSDTMTDEIAKKYGFASKNALDAWWGIKTTTTGWRLNLNENGEMNPTGTETNKVYLRASAVNSNGKFGSWSGNQYIAISKSAPGMSEKIYQFKTAPSSSNVTTVTSSENVIGEKDYASGMYVKGQWYIETTAKETTTGSNVTIESVTIDGETLAKGTGYFVTSERAASIKVYIPIDKDAASTTVYKVTAVDGTGLYSATSTYSINVDNTAPAINPLYSDYDNTAAIRMTKIENSNYKYDVYSKTVEEGAGLDFMAVYFMRDGKIELPLPSIISTTTSETKVTAGNSYTGTTGTTGTLTKLTSDEAGEALYGVSGTVSCATSGTNTVITADSLITSDNSFIRVGSLVKLSGSYYPITAVDTSAHTATVATTFGTPPTSAFFPAAIAVNTKGEGGSTSGGTTTISKDDGDGFMEAFDVSGTNYAWQLEFFSDELDDGQINIVVVAADKAGNYSTETTAVMLTNHKPRVSKVFLATDLNGDGKYTDNELGGQAITSSEGGTLTQKYYSTLSGSTINSSGELEGSAQEISTLSYKADEKDSSGNYYGVGFTMRNKLGVALEFVGGREGNNDLKYQLSVVSSTDGILTAPTAGTKGDVTTRTSSLYDTTAETTTASIVSSELKGFEIETSDISGHTEWVEATENTHVLSNIGITLWDSTKGTDAGTGDSYTLIDSAAKDVESNRNYTEFGSQWTVINMPMYIDLTDDVSPKVTIDSIDAYEENNTVYGHVEKSDSLPISIFNQTANRTAGSHTEYDNDPKISGRVLIKGTINDEKRIGSVTLKMTGGNNGEYVYMAESAKTVASYGNGTLDVKAINGAAWTFTLSNETFDKEKGHSVDWTIDLPTVAILASSDENWWTALDLNIEVTANDGTSNHDTLANQYVDVVPYITGIHRSATTKSVVSKTYRSTYGEYPVAIGDTITVTGFNLGGGTANNTQRTRPVITVGNQSISSYTIETGNEKISFSVPDCSGELVFTVNGIRSLNDQNDNSQTNNQETADSVTNNAKSSTVDGNVLYDNRYLRVWDVGHYFKYSTDGYMPTLATDNQGNLFTTWTLMGTASVQMQRGLNNTNKAVFYHYDQPDQETWLSVDKSVTNGNMSVMVFPANVGSGGTPTVNGYADGKNIGGAWGIGVPNDLSTGISYEKRSVSKLAVTIDGNPYYNTDGNMGASGFQLASYAMRREVSQFKNARTVRYDDSMHYAYYDKKNKALRYTCQPIVTDSEDTVDAYQYIISGWNLIDGKTDGQDRVHAGPSDTWVTGKSDLVYNITKNGNTTFKPTTITKNSVTYNTFTPNEGETIGIASTTASGIYNYEIHTVTSVEGYKAIWSDGDYDTESTLTGVTVYRGDSNVVTNGVERVESAGSYLTIDVTSSGYPVIIYYDAINDTLRIAHTTSKTPSMSSKADGADTWTRQSLSGIVSGGTYVQAKIDGNNYLHILYRDSEGQLCYLKSTNNPDGAAYTFSENDVMVVDTAGTYGTLSLIRSGTGTYTYTPCVSFLNSEGTANGVKYALLRTVDIGGGETASRWDTMIVPAVSGNYVTGGEYIYTEGYNGWTANSTEITDRVNTADCDAIIGYNTGRMDVLFLKSAQ